jgi:hypothetical protein
LYERADAILAGTRIGLARPIFAHLSLRGHADAMLAFADFAPPGPAALPFSDVGLIRRALRRGSARAAQHLAIGCFNRRDLSGYRYWLARGARMGDVEAAEERRRFEIRLPHGAARDIGRHRPYRAEDDLWTANRRASKATRHYPPDRFRPAGEQ